MNEKQTNPDSIQNGAPATSDAAENMPIKENAGADPADLHADMQENGTWTAPPDPEEVAWKEWKAEMLSRANMEDPEFMSRLTNGIAKATARAAQDVISDILQEASSAVARIVDEWKELDRYLDKELKKPEYGGKTLDELWDIAEAEAETGERFNPDSLYARAMNNARAAMNQKQERRTKSKAGDVITQLPQKIASPTLKNYEYATSLHDAGGAHLAVLTDADKLEIKNGRIFFKGKAQPISAADLKNMQTDLKIEDITPIDLPLLRILYSIILQEAEKTKYTEIKDETSLYLPDLAECLGMPRNLNALQAETVLKKVKSYQNIVGVIREYTYGNWRESQYAVMVFHSYDAKTNVIRFSSPYMKMVIQKAFNESIKMDKNNKPKLKANGAPDTKPAYSYLVDTSIAKERNKAAVENVFIICSVIERAGNSHKPHISAKEIIERNQQLKKRLEKSTNPGQILKGCFSKTWELLRTKTDLEGTYIDIELPDPKDPAAIPTVKTLPTLVFTFKHAGKRKDAAPQDAAAGGQK